MKEENQKKPKLKRGDQVWYIDGSHCPYKGECDLSHPCVMTGHVVSVLQAGSYYTLSDRSLVGADNVYLTPDAAEEHIPEALKAKIERVKDGLASLEAALENHERN